MIPPYPLEVKPEYPVYGEADCNPVAWDENCSFSNCV